MKHMKRVHSKSIPRGRSSHLAVFALFAALIVALTVSGMPFSSQNTMIPTGMLVAPTEALAGAEVGLWIVGMALLVPIEILVRRKLG